MRLYIYVNDDVNDVYFLRLRNCNIYIVLLAFQFTVKYYFVKFIIVILHYNHHFWRRRSSLLILSRSSAPDGLSLLFFVAQHKKEKNINNISLFFYTWYCTHDFVYYVKKKVCWRRWHLILPKRTKQQFLEFFFAWTYH